MSRRFLSGARGQVLALMAEHAVRDQQALIDAHIPRHGQPDESARKVIAECRARIQDYRRIAASSITKEQQP